MKCIRCEAILPPHYKKCPVCGKKELEREKFAPQEVNEEEEAEPITPYAIAGDIDDYEVGE